MADSYPLSDGDYLIDAALSGGSGKASIKSPAKLHIDGSNMTAEIEWSSSNYDYMELDGNAYTPVNENGNSLFIVEVPILDTPIPFKAETTAMSEPHMIEYTLYLSSQTAQRQGTLGWTAAGITGAGMAVILIFAAVILKKRYRNVKK